MASPQALAGGSETYLEKPRTDVPGSPSLISRADKGFKSPGDVHKLQQNPLDDMTVINGDIPAAGCPPSDISGNL